MARIAKHRVHAALDRAVQNLKLAAGPDKRLAKADLKHAVDVIEDQTERDLTDMFGRFTGHRDAGKGKTVGFGDLDKAADYAKKKMVDDYDVNQNGLSKKEIGKMSFTGQLAVRLAAKDL